VRPCDRERIRATSQALKGAKLSSQDFESALSHATKRDLVYLDPPYTVAHGNNGFVKYNAKIFSWNDQLRLAAIAENLATLGCKVLISNADHPSIRKLYRGFRAITITRPSRIAASSSYRRYVTECLFHS